MTAPYRRTGIAVLLAACAALAACTGGQAPTAAASSAAAPASPPAACGSPVETGPLPDWASAGFSGSSAIPHVFGRNGDIAAVLFAHPLTAARTDGMSNKILWVSHPQPTSDPLVITGRLDGTGDPVVRTVDGGPGPSIIDFPQAGCWRLTLTWSGHTDTLDLVYA
ncbi:hypothetical protein QEZ54_11085 [Catellatospora sp. KI3]|uniref:hypothetical protein n=1 Tax=Catellatospora sp. KI3 TaxID=3041620 RepID=UPI002483096B|nr:hypothetical protein [Catellatospora sp. KI3]MDI1461516.1 hypothetical protein [Catellatospora sp. KI3]